LTELNHTQPASSFKVLVIGDSCYDIYHYGTVARISPEAPVPVFDFKYSETKKGMASNVYNNFIALGINVDIQTFFVEEKHRYIDLKSKQQLLRVDQPCDSSTTAFDIRAVDLQLYDAVVISDYNKGFVNYDHIELLQQQFARPIFVDTKKTDLQQFTNCILKINDHEWSRRTSDHANTIITCGSHGVRYNNTHYATAAIEIYDVCGAGDTFLAALVYEYLNTQDMHMSIQFAQQAAAITVRHTGVYAPTLEEIENASRRIC